MLRINPEVKKAIEEGRPVVALESTIISHGMPFPKNINTALKVEEEIRKCGAVPATIGIVNGDAVIGMSVEEISAFGDKRDIYKASRLDLPIVYAKKLWASTTVAATMILAQQAGIKVFVTGGIGGVHREAETTMDISADLQELAKTNVTVVCAGAKAILDLPKTMEYLETMGVAVLGYQTDELPAFYTRESGLKVNYRVDSPEEIAEIMKEKNINNYGGGLLVMNPIPKEYEADKKMIDDAIAQALDMAKKEGISGKRTTPFLLRTISNITEGKSLQSNIHLILNNARLGAQISKAYSERTK